MSDPEIMGFGSARSTYGNAKAVSGMQSLIKELLCHELGYMMPQKHLSRINPHIFQDEDSSFHLVTETMPQRMNSAFSGITGKGFGGSCGHAIVWGAVNFKRVSLPTPVLHQQDIVYWPGGGGDLDMDAVPNRNYHIVGSWSSLSIPQPMKAEGQGVYTFTATMGELGYERFQIWLDGDPDRVLHPGMPGAEKDVPISGPDDAGRAEGYYWMISNGDSQKMLALYDDQAIGEVEDGPISTLPGCRLGDTYKIQLLVNGKYRLVTWSKVEADLRPGMVVATKGQASPAGRYYVSGSWNNWSFEEMEESGGVAGLYRATVQVTRRDTLFTIVRNEDWHQMIYPSYQYARGGQENPIFGPDEQGRGFQWLLEGTPGDMYDIELQLNRGGDGCATYNISWHRKEIGMLTPAQEFAASLPKYFIAGSWDNWASRQLLVSGRAGHTHQIVLQGRPESFVILQEGDWNRALHPPTVSSGDGEDIRGPSVFHPSLAWTIDDSEEDNIGRYEVEVIMRSGRPAAVRWKKL